MQRAIQEASDFLQFHSDWDDDDCRKAFGVLEDLVASFDCLDRRECYEMYESTTTVVLGSVDLDQIGRGLEAFGPTRTRIAESLEALGIPDELPVVHAISRRLQARFETDKGAHAEIEELFAEVDHHVMTTKKVAVLDYVTNAFEDEDWVVETLAVITAMREKEAS